MTANEKTWPFSEIDEARQLYHIASREAEKWRRRHDQATRALHAAALLIASLCFHIGHLCGWVESGTAWLLPFVISVVLLPFWKLKRWQDRRDAS